MRLTLACGSEKLSLEFPDGTPVSVAQVLQCTRDKRPDLHGRWCDADGAIRGSLHVFVDGVNIRYREGLETELSDGSEVYVIPLVTGG